MFNSLGPRSLKIFVNTCSINWPQRSSVWWTSSAMAIHVFMFKLLQQGDRSHRMAQTGGSVGTIRGDGVLCFSNCASNIFILQFTSYTTKKGRVGGDVMGLRSCDEPRPFLRTWCRFPDCSWLRGGCVTPAACWIPPTSSQIGNRISFIINFRMVTNSNKPFTTNFLVERYFKNEQKMKKTIERSRKKKKKSTNMNTQ